MEVVNGIWTNVPCFEWQSGLGCGRRILKIVVTVYRKKFKTKTNTLSTYLYAYMAFD